MPFLSLFTLYFIDFAVFVFVFVLVLVVVLAAIAVWARDEDDEYDSDVVIVVVVELMCCGVLLCTLCISQYYNDDYFFSFYCFSSHTSFCNCRDAHVLLRYSHFDFMARK